MFKAVATLANTSGDALSHHLVGGRENVSVKTDFHIKDVPFAEWAQRWLVMLTGNNLGSLCLVLYMITYGLYGLNMVEAH